MSKNEVVLEAFFEYCVKHPEQRFWQAMRNFTGAKFILFADDIDVADPTKFVGCKDTFFFEHKNK